MTDVDNSQLSGTWTLDPSHSRIGFNSRHAMVTKVRGAFNDISGRAVLDLEDADASHVEVDVRMDSIDTRAAQRDEHLRGADFFDVAQYPLMTFRSTHVEEVDDNGFIVTGDLTIRDTTRTMSIPLSFVGLAEDPFGNLRAGFEGTRRIDRRDWGVSWNTPLDKGGALVSDKIVLEFELSLIKDPVAADAATETSADSDDELIDSAPLTSDAEHGDAAAEASHEEFSAYAPPSSTEGENAEHGDGHEEHRG